MNSSWLHGRPPAAKPGLLFYIMVDSLALDFRTLSIISRKVPASR